ncbi:unnamed protein product [Diplocarpon coronariae]
MSSIPSNSTLRFYPADEAERKAQRPSYPQDLCEYSSVPVGSLGCLQTAAVGQEVQHATWHSGSTKPSVSALGSRWPKLQETC